MLHLFGIAALAFALQGKPESDNGSKVSALLEKVAHAYSTLHTLNETVSEHFEKHEDDAVKVEDFTHRFELEKPDKVYIERRIARGQPESIVISNGTSVWLYHPERKEYTNLAPDKAKFYVDQLAFENLFLHPEENAIASLHKMLSLSQFQGKTQEMITQEKVNGTLCDVLSLVVGLQGDQVINRYYFGPDHLLRRTGLEIWKKGVLLDQTNMVVRRLAVNKPIPAARFQFSPPPATKQVQ